jgi:hypothetical protein
MSVGNSAISPAAKLDDRSDTASGHFPPRGREKQLPPGKKRRALMDRGNTIACPDGFFRDLFLDVATDRCAGQRDAFQVW